MKTIKISPVDIIGNCPVGLTRADEFQIEGLVLKNPENSKLCFLAVSQLPIGQGIWQVQREERFLSHVSCSGCTVKLEQENRVVFLMGHEDKWELCQAISEYLRLSKQYGEPELAVKLKEEAIQQQGRGEYSLATETMESALREWGTVHQYLHHDRS